MALSRFLPGLSIDTLGENRRAPAHPSHTKCLIGSASSALEDIAVSENEVSNWIRAGISGATTEQGSFRVVLCSSDAFIESHLPFSHEDYEGFNSTYNLSPRPSQDLLISKFLSVSTEKGTIGIVQILDFLKVHLALEHDPNHKTTVCILRFMFREDLEAMMQRLRSITLYAWHPLAIPTLLIESIAMSIPPKIEILRSQRIDDETMQALPLVSADFVKLRYRAEVSCTILNSMEEHLQRFGTLPPDTVAEPATVSVITKLGYLRCCFQNILLLCTSLIAENDQKSQAVVNTMANLEKARNEREAVNTRVFNLATFVFLPITAMATFFSMSFFDFREEGKLVSSRLWIFLVMTVPISLILNLGWPLFVKHRGKDK